MRKNKCDIVLVRKYCSLTLKFSDVISRSVCIFGKEEC